jgi:hypothetical protein
VFYLDEFLAPVRVFVLALSHGSDCLDLDEFYNKAGKASEAESEQDKTNTKMEIPDSISIMIGVRSGSGDIETVHLVDEYIETQRRREHWSLP